VDPRLSSLDGQVDSINGTIASNIMPHLSGLDGQVGSINGTIASNIMPHLSAHDGKLEALEEFVRVLLQTYAITKPGGGSYAYNGAKQNLL
jgi:hypothetical protein